MAVTSSTIFIRHMQIRWVGFTTDQSHSFWAWSEWLMTTTTTDTCFVHQTKAQRNHCTVGKSEMCPAQLDLQCLDYHMLTEKMVNVPLWTKMFAQMRTTQILSDTFKYTAVGLSSCRDLLLSKKPCVVVGSEVNAGWKLDRSELTTLTRLRLESLVRWGSHSLRNLNQSYHRRCVQPEMQEYWRSQAYTDENRACLLHLRRWDSISLIAGFYYMLAPPLMPQQCVHSLCF